MKTIVIGYAFSMALLLGTAARADLSDPTRPYDGQRTVYQPSYSGPVLQSTRISGKNKTAVISGRLVSVGDVVDGAIVADIHPYEVLLNRGGRETTLRLYPKLTKEKGRVE